MPIHPLNKIWLIIPWNFFYFFFNKSYSKCLCWWSEEGHLCASYLNCICQKETAVTLPPNTCPLTWKCKMEKKKKRESKIQNTIMITWLDSSCWPFMCYFIWLQDKNKTWKHPSCWQSISSANVLINGIEENDALPLTEQVFLVSK